MLQEANSGRGNHVRLGHRRHDVLAKGLRRSLSLRHARATGGVDSEFSIRVLNECRMDILIGSVWSGGTRSCDRRGRHEPTRESVFREDRPSRDTCDCAGLTAWLQLDLFDCSVIDKPFPCHATNDLRFLQAADLQDFPSQSIATQCALVP